MSTDHNYTSNHIIRVDILRQADESEARGNTVRADQLRQIAEYYEPEPGIDWPKLAVWTAAIIFCIVFWAIVLAPMAASLLMAQ